MFFRQLLVAFVGAATVVVARPSAVSQQHHGLYKQATTSRGYKYNFIAVPPKCDTKPVLLFLHGFPSSSRDWHNQVEYFAKEGYGIVAPDLLGYGGTDKPEDPLEYRSKAMAQDVLDVLDSLPWTNSTPVVSISHDWGSGLNSRLMLHFTERFAAYAYISLGGLAIQTGPVDFDVILPRLKAALGYEMIAYHEFFANVPDAAEVIEANIDSFVDMLVPVEPETWKTTLGTRYLTEALMRNGTRSERAPWFTERDAATTKDTLVAGGLTGPLNWYKLYVQGLNVEDDATVATKKVDAPTLYVAGTRDAVCVPSMQLATVKSFANNVETVSFETGHWIFWEQPAALNAALRAFVDKVVAA